jgi:hypothetical protein
LLSRKIACGRLVKAMLCTEVRGIHNLIRDNCAMLFKIRERIVAALPRFKFAGHVEAAHPNEGGETGRGSPVIGL